LIFSGKFCIVNLNRRAISRGAIYSNRANGFGVLFCSFFAFNAVSGEYRKQVIEISKDVILSTRKLGEYRNFKGC